MTASPITTEESKMSDITITVTREVAQALCDRAEILHHDDNEMPGVPNGTLYDTRNGRWTWSLEEAARWAVVSIAEED